MRTRPIASLTFVLVLALVVAACGPARPGGDDTADDDPNECAEGLRRCTGQTLERCTGGAWVTVETCPNACTPELGCTLCAPGTGTCNGDMSRACRPDGQGFVDEYCDPVMGSTCDQTTGVCVGPCAANTLGTSYIGCDYWPTQTSQLVNPSWQFAVAISNTSEAVATVTIDGGALGAPVTMTVPPGDVAIRTLPWVPLLKNCNTEGFLECGAPQNMGALAVGGAYHLRSTQPVTVYQFSPLDYARQGSFSYANDASLLLPTNAWTGSYMVPAWQAWNPGFAGVMPSLMAITAYQDGTQVTITTRAATPGGNGSPAFTAGAPQTVTLDKGDVIQLLAFTGDLTGSVVDADKPVQVIAGHHCTQVPIGYTACDHLEESVFPQEALSTSYIVSAPYLPSLNGPRHQTTRITATRASTTVTLDPPIAGPFNLAQPGDFVEIAQRNEDFHVVADGKVVVTHYMPGQDAPPAAGTGDPAMTLAVPTDQYRTTYLFHAPTNYESNFVNVTAPIGATVMVDGNAVTAFTPIGNSGLGVARVPLANSGNGNHRAESSTPFGITVYGYGQYTSFWYPGGLDLTPIPIE